MSIFADQAWVAQFHDTLHLTYQQKGSLLENLIDPGMVHRGVTAAIDYHERLGNLIASDIIQPFGQINAANPEHSRRAVTLQSSHLPVLISDENTLRSMVNPQSAYTRTLVYAMGRRADKHIIDAALGTATTGAVTAGSGLITHGSVALPAGQKIGTGIAITGTNVISLATLLSKAGCQNGAGERILLYSPGQLPDILLITQATSSDFTKNQISDRGTINGVQWQGFLWVEIADVVDPSIAVLQRMLPLSSTTRSCIAFCRDSIGLSIGKEITTTFDVRSDLQSRPTQVRSHMMMIAGRLFEGGVAQLDVLEN